MKKFVGVQEEISSIDSPANTRRTKIKGMKCNNY